jgi:cysteine synthase A
MINRAEEIGQQDDAYWTRQFTNKDAIEGYRNLGREILKQIEGPIHGFCGAVGTAGMITGVSKELKLANAQTQIVVLEPASAPLLSQGVKGTHMVEGIGVGFVPPLLEKQNYDKVKAIEEAKAREMAKRLAVHEGIFAGTSTGLNVAAAIEIGQELGSNYTIVTVACDSGMKYLASGLFD